MFLQQLSVAGFRNLHDQRIVLGSGLNVFYGYNGSGKTSILEFVHVLGSGRSFRCSNLQQVIKHGCDKYSINAQLMLDSGLNVSLGAEKNLSGIKGFRVAGKSAKAEDLAQLLPVQAITIDSHKLIDAAPDYRRKFADWAMFHVEHEFWSNWKQFKQSLAQRNALLKHSQGRPNAEIHDQLMAWQDGFVQSAVKLDAFRKIFVAKLQDLLAEVLTLWLPGMTVKLVYEQGWPQDQDYNATLLSSLKYDSICGFTSKGPHRADIEFLIDGFAAKSYLSRGQQKLLVCALFLARARLLFKFKQKPSVFLLDDLDAELDVNSSSCLLRELLVLQSQVLVTNINPLSQLQKNELNSDVVGFNVNSGLITNAII